MNKPSFMIIGARKSGTTSLFHYLQQHPRLHPSFDKELNYFDRSINFGITIDEYYSYFNNALGKKNPLFFEATPGYLYKKDVPARIKKYLGNVKLIAILRNPVDRAYSDWNMFRIMFETDRHMLKDKHDSPELGYNSFYHFLIEGRKSFPSLSEAIEIELSVEKQGFEEPSILRRGKYIEQLKRYWQYFPKESMLVLKTGELEKNTNKTLNTVLKFLGLDAISWDFLDRTKLMVKPYKMEMEEKDRQFLNDYYDRYNKELFSEIGEINWGKNE